MSDAPILGVVCHDTRKSGFLFPWQRGERVKKWALHRYRVMRARYREARRVARLARLKLRAVTSMAQVVDLLTSRQVRYQLGALPVLYVLLETLQVRQIINRHCPTRADVDHGTVALVLVLNRLMLPLPLVQISDWVGQTVLAAQLGIPAAKFNDDRLGRTLDALYPHLDVIWQEIVAIALDKTQIDLSLLFYDMTGIVGHGRYEGSELMDFGFAHNTPSNKRKLKLGANVSADGNIPVAYAPWSGRTADQATVMSNMEKLARWLSHHGHAGRASLIVGDRAMLNAEIAIAYDKHGLRHLTGLKAATPDLKQLVGVWSDEQMEKCPIEEGPSPRYWGRGTQVTFEHEGESVTHKAVVVVSGPLRDQLRQSRQARIRCPLCRVGNPQFPHRPAPADHGQVRSAQRQRPAAGIQSGQIRPGHGLRNRHRSGQSGLAGQRGSPGPGRTHGWPLSPGHQRLASLPSRDVSDSTGPRTGSRPAFTSAKMTWPSRPSTCIRTSASPP